MYGCRNHSEVRYASMENGTCLEGWYDFEAVWPTYQSRKFKPEKERKRRDLKSLHLCVNNIHRMVEFVVPRPDAFQCDVCIRTFEAGEICSCCR